VARTRENTPFLVLLGLAFAVSAIVSILARGNRRRRAGEMAALAASLGCTFEPDPEPEFSDEYPLFACFSQGHDRAAVNTIRGVWKSDARPYPVRLGDFTYKTGDRSDSVHRFSYLLVQIPFANVPDLSIRHADPLDRIAEAFGADRVRLESDEFNRRFLVRSSDHKFAYDVLSPKVMEWFLAGDPPAFEMLNGCFCLHSGPSGWSVEEFRSHLAWVERFIKLWPDFLIQRLDTGT
jgi:hypothetical protein